MPTCQGCGKYVAENQVCQHCNQAAVEHTFAESMRDVPIPDLPIPDLPVQGLPVQGLTVPLRPAHRPPTPRLIVLDDDSDTEGEIIRLRRTETRLGRYDCDVSIGHDADISGCHAKILREEIKPSSYRWRLLDNSSTNGTFVRRNLIELYRDQLVLVGGVPVQWQCSGPDGTAEVRIDGDSGNRTFRLTSQVLGPLWLGRDPQHCRIVIDDPRVDDKHAVLSRQPAGWQLQDQHAYNGIWESVDDCILSGSSYFLLGEQRFLFQIPGSQ